MSSVSEQLPLRNDFAGLGAAFSSRVAPEPIRNPKMVAWDPATAQRLGITGNGESYLPYISGQQSWPDSDAVAMVYSGHQFGHFAGQLGDGRGLLLGDLQHQGQFWDIHLKGAGRTPYSRFGDGRAVLRSCIREYLASIAMNGLGIATSHALCIVTGDEKVTRETLEPRAMLVRVAHTHVRFGSFEHFFHAGREDLLRQLADFVIQRFLPSALDAPDRYEQLYALAVENTAIMIAQWQAQGFAHGVMNTDNMSIIGETLDYGPYGFMETYDPGLICNHSDHSGRYAFNKQPEIGFWNLQVLAQSLSPLIPTERLVHHLQRYSRLLSDTYASAMRAKLGLRLSDPRDQALNAAWLDLVQKAGLDYHLSFRALAASHTADGQQTLITLFEASGLQQAAADWMQQYTKRISEEGSANEDLATRRLAANPLYVLRNYLAQNAIQSAESGDYSGVATLANLLRNPYQAQPNSEEFTHPAPAWAQDLTVSCSS